MIQSVDDLEAAIRAHHSAPAPAEAPRGLWQPDPAPTWETLDRPAPAGIDEGLFGGKLAFAGNPPPLEQVAPHVVAYLQKQALVGATIQRGAKALLGRALPSAATSAAPAAAAATSAAPSLLSRAGDVAGLGMTLSAVPEAAKPVRS